MSARFITRLFVILVALVGAFFLYCYLFVSIGPSETPGLQAVGATDASGQPSAADDEFISLLERLREVKLDSDLFTSPAWKSLVNFRVDLVPEDKGRRNPFSPVGFDSPSSTSTSPASTSPLR